MDYQDQNQQKREEQGSTQQNPEQNKPVSGGNMPNSAGGDQDYGNFNDEQRERKNREQSENPEETNWEDTDRDETEMRRGDEGRFNNKLNQEREEGLSEDKRREARDEDLQGRHPEEGSIL